MKLKVHMKDYRFDKEDLIEQACDIPTLTGKKSSLNTPLIIHPGNSAPMGSVEVDILLNITLLNIH